MNGTRPDRSPPPRQRLDAAAERPTQEGQLVLLEPEDRRTVREVDGRRRGRMAFLWQGRAHQRRAREEACVAADLGRFTRCCDRFRRRRDFLSKRFWRLRKELGGWSERWGEVPCWWLAWEEAGNDRISQGTFSELFRLHRPIDEERARRVEEKLAAERAASRAARAAG